MLVDARGCSCPQPILMTKNALKKASELDVLVDNQTAKENVVRFATNQGCSVNATDTPDGEFKITITK